MTAKKEKRLEKHGYFAVKGKFGYVKKDNKRKTVKNKSKKNKYILNNKINEDRILNCYLILSKCPFNQSILLLKLFCFLLSFFIYL